MPLGGRPRIQEWVTTGSYRRRSGTATMEERRNLNRQRTFLQGRLFFNSRRNSVDCIIRDLSDTGARLQFSAAVAVPDALELYVPHKDQMFRVRVEWRPEQESVIDVQEGESE